MFHVERNRIVFLLTSLVIVGIAITCPRGVSAGERHTTASTQAIGQPNDPHSCYLESFGSIGVCVSPCSSIAGAGYANAFSWAGFKSVRVISYSSKLFGTAGGHGDALSTASATESLSFSTSQAPIGEPMQVLIALGVEGDISGSATCAQGQTAWEAGGVLTLYYGPGGLSNKAEVARGEFDNNPDSPNDTFETGTINVQITWQNGVAFDVMMHGFTWSNITALGACTGEANADLASTFTWQGVASVTDSKGNPITQYTLVDEYGNDWTTPPSIADITSDGTVGVPDLLAVINAWGSCGTPCPSWCNADIAPVGGDCQVGVPDLLTVINNWGG